MNRAGWRNLAIERLGDAKALLGVGRWSGAYYLAGYGIECALKACILARVEADGIIFDDPKFSASVRTHRPEDLVRLANLEADFGIARGANVALQANWNIVLIWSEESRYTFVDQAGAEQLYAAVSDLPDGVISWFQIHW